MNAPRARPETRPFTMHKDPVLEARHDALLAEVAAEGGAVRCGRLWRLLLSDREASGKDMSVLLRHAMVVSDGFMARVSELGLGQLRRMKG